MPTQLEQLLEERSIIEQAFNDACEVEIRASNDIVRLNIRLVNIDDQITILQRRLDEELKHENTKI